MKLLRQLALLGAAYFLFALLGARWATVSGAASPVFPAAGVGLAGLLLWGTRLWPAIFLGRLAVAVLDGSLPFWADVAIAAGNALAAVVGAEVFRHTGLDLSLRRLRDVLGLSAVMLAHSAIAATVGVGSLAAARAMDPGAAGVVWLSWWVGDVSGGFVMAPLLLAWGRGGPVSRDRTWWLNLTSSAVTSVALTWLVFLPPERPLLRTFLIFPCLMWAALGAGVRGATLVFLPVSAIALWGTTLGFGPLATAGEIAGQPIRFLLLQQFIVIAALTSLVLAAVADERRGKEALQVSQERLALALEAGRLGFWDWHIPSGHVTYGGLWERMLGYGPGETEPHVRGWERLVHPEDRERVTALLRDHLEGRADFYESEHRLRHTDGSWRWILARGRVVQWQDGGQPIRAVGTHTDVTSRKEAEAERAELLQRERNARLDAERAVRLKDDFLSTLSHELRTPLNAIMGWSQLVLRRLDGPPGDLHHALTAIDRNARMQARLVEDLLDMSGIISGKLRLNIEPVDLRDVVSAAIASVAPAAEAKDIRLEWNGGPSPEILQADAARLQQIVWNLLSNAIRFTPPGGAVKAGLARLPGHLAISVSDTGQGIAPEFLPYVFDRFRQADSSTTRHQGGLGLGLAIVKNLAELHGGSAHATSDGLGHGATFTIMLPLTAADAKHDTQAATAGRAEAQEVAAGVVDLRGVSVLFVDDEPDARQVVARLLEETRACVTVAASAGEALRVLQSDPPDVLVSDIGMPGLDGYDLIRAIRALPVEGGGGVRSIALTAYARPEDHTRALLAGFDLHLPKPVALAHLSAAIASLMGRPGGSSAAGVVRNAD
ncbi:MAG: MASE1 domain-containing protein [Acidobacteria bacterium]|nr:MASE1 domain-containing protein [Acidobacteriota bacterium]